MEAFFKNFKASWSSATEDKRSLLREVFRNVTTGPIIPSEQSRRMMMAFAKIDPPPPQNQESSESEISAVEEEEMKTTKVSKKREESQDARYRQDRSPASSTKSDPRKSDDSRKRSHSPSSPEISKKPCVFQVFFLTIMFPN